MEERKEKDGRTEPKYWMGIIWFAVVLVIMILTFPQIQGKLGMVGLAITEGILLLLAVIPVLIMRWDPKEVFRIRIPKLSQVFGTLLIWLGTYLLTLCCSLTVMYIFPQESGETRGALVSFFNSVPPVLAFFIIAGTPAICEEALHRGLICFTFRNVKRKWVVVLAGGFIFGVFHLDPVRFLETAILGAAFTFVLLETENFLLPVLMHFVNNALAALVSLSNTETASGEMMKASVELLTDSTLYLGVFYLMAVVAPFILLFGTALLHKKEKLPAEATPQEKRSSAFLTVKRILGTSICSAIFGVTGMILIVIGVVDMMNRPVVSQFDVQDNREVTQDYVHETTVLVNQTGEYRFIVVVEGGDEQCSCEVKLFDEQGELRYASGRGGEMVIESMPVALQAGDYQLCFEYRCEEGAGEKIFVKTICK